MEAHINCSLKTDFGGKFIFYVKDLNIDSAFYKELLQWWAEFRSEFSTQPPTAECIIWNNKNITVDGKSVYYHNYVNAGIIKCSHLLFHKSNLESYECAKRQGLANTNFLIWSRLRIAIPTHLKASDLNQSGQRLLGFHCDKSYFNPELCKTKQFYH